MDLSLRESVMKRPGMYFGGVRTRSALHVLLESLVVDSIAVAGARETTVHLLADGTIALADDGARFCGDLGVWTRLDGSARVRAVEVGPGEWVGIGGLLPAVAAASAWLVARTATGEIAFVKGRPSPLRLADVPLWSDPAIAVVLRPDPAIFGDGTRGSAHRLLAQVQGLTLAFPGIAVSVHDDTAGTYRLSYLESFVNARRVTSGGVHVDALLDALDRCFGRGRAPPLSAVFGLRLGDPRWAGSVKECLLDPRAYDLAARALATLPGAVAAVRGDLAHAGTADQRGLRTRSPGF